ncbi:MAG: molybdopterin-guanine dinucleotide biosynthesis protein B [Syntrophomonadaceae bacterium]|jgi:molybdopterin-guanine dinucleotide biosynthesis protein B|nr:molybdopterin-guanine dinucleotide biosynthesis protein B [Syntrophomonadaceae bacterium]
MSKIMGFVGFSNSGKTTVISNLIKIFSQRGLQAAAIKHASHGYQIDTPGKDSYQHFQAGATRVVLIGPDSMTTHQRLTSMPPLQEILQEMDDVDIVLVEGFKQDVSPKILVYRAEGQKDPGFPPGVYEALISDSVLPLQVPSFTFQEMEKVADFIVHHGQ